jgi:hypothetical protein
MGWYGLDWSGSELQQMEGSCERGNELWEVAMEGSQITPPPAVFYRWYAFLSSRRVDTPLALCEA